MLISEIFSAMVTNKKYVNKIRIMFKWERRLADAAHALASCGKTYMEPELFRRNVNQFLTVARTVTFLIAKDKNVIPEYEKWHSESIGKYWSGDPIMKWAKESRNFIEKEGDLELYSSLSVSLVHSYFDEEDISLEVGRSELLGAGVKKLMRIAEKGLPSGIADAAAVKIDRRWVANTLPDHELFQALIYVYSRYYKACDALAAYLGSKLSTTVPQADEMGEGDVSGVRVSYVKFNGRESYHLKTYRFERDREQKKPNWVKDIDVNLPKFDVFSEMAESTFLQFGEHVSMIFLLSEEGAILRYMGFAPADQVDKFIFWRHLAEQVIFLRAYSLIFVSETWLRKNPGISVPIRKAEIVGEILQVYEIKKNGKSRVKSWEIIRQDTSVSLGKGEVQNIDADEIPSFLIPIKKAFIHVHGQ